MSKASGRRSYGNRKSKISADHQHLLFRYLDLKAKLLADSNALAQEITRLRQSGNVLSGDAQRAALYSFFFGRGISRGRGYGKF